MHKHTRTHRPVRYGMGEVYKELHDVLVPGVIPKGAGHGFKCKPVKRRYAFEVEDVPRVSVYVRGRPESAGGGGAARLVVPEQLPGDAPGAARPPPRASRGRPAGPDRRSAA